MINAHSSINNIIVGALATNCWLYSCTEDTSQESEGLKPCAIIDPGADPAVIIARLDRLQLYPRYILFTHGHFDHVAGLYGLAAHYSSLFASGLEIAIHQEDALYLGPNAYQVHRDSFIAAAGNAVYVDALWEDIPAPTRLLTEGDQIGPFKVLHLPGHSPGSIGFYDEQAQVLFSGDTLFKAGVGRTDLPGGDWEKLQASLDRLFAMNGGLTVYPGHGPETTIASER
jgi:glyoxylase-like metal-dependent hydrolase (beta-lactamase superfamily II)